MTKQTFALTAVVALIAASASAASATRNIPIWPGLAPGETSNSPGETQPFRKGEVPPVTRVVKIRKPSMDIFLPGKNANGVGVLILPGGGFGKVVTDKEGSEAAAWLNKLGIAAFVLRYRTSEATPGNEPPWLRPLQDTQRALRMIRTNAREYGIQPDNLGVLGFSAGGQVAAILHTRDGKADYKAGDDIDHTSCRPEFSLLIYPWNVLDRKTGDLLPDIRPSASSATAFIVHTHDDRSSSLGSVLIYAGLKKHKVSAELHVYANGGHGYGMRTVKGSQIHTWPDRASDWLRANGLAGKTAN